MTKTKLVEEILKIKAIDTKVNLMKKTLKELEGILSDLQVEKPNNTESSLTIDKDALLKEMKAQLLEELKEEARKEIEAETSLSEESLELNKPVAKKNIDRFEPIPVMSVSIGTLIYHSKKSGNEWIWGEYGDIEYIEYNELQTMRSSQRRFIDEPFLIILDEDVVYNMGLEKTYASFDKNQLQSLDYVFKLNQSEFTKAVDSLPTGIQHSLVMRARKLHANGTLDSIKKVNYLNEKFGTDIGKRG